MVSHFKGGTWAHGQSVPPSLVAIAVANLWVQEGSLQGGKGAASDQAKQTLKLWSRHTIGIHPTHMHCTHCPTFLRLPIFIDVMVPDSHPLFSLLVDSLPRVCQSMYVIAHGASQESFPWRLDVSIQSSQASFHRPRWRFLHLSLCIFPFLQPAHAKLRPVEHTSLVEKKLLLLSSSKPWMLLCWS